MTLCFSNRLCLLVVLFLLYIYIYIFTQYSAGCQCIAYRGWILSWQNFGGVTSMKLHICFCSYLHCYIKKDTPAVSKWTGTEPAEQTLKTGSQRERNYYDFCRKHKEGWKWAGIIWNSVPAPSVNEQLNLIGRLLHITVKWVHFSCAAAWRHFQWQHGDTCMVIRK